MRDGMTSVGKAVGCQFVGKPYGEADLVRLANAYESEA
jgi:Asp-tRNA(Asn)/Glu-tRNA(Gln) amidotransferase A subunit family amidase